ncbi:Meiosis protein MEI2 [Penicillium vulpinum]|nr:Meiosis protein MEI2 [Penicillium vulpinum]KAJ5972664.1 Meiosis protein MEI2 [Penicillium vulpinum]
MDKPPSTRGSPSEQLAAFTPMGYEAFAQRANPVSFAGMKTIRPTGDPFAGLSMEPRSGPSLPVSQITAANPTSGYARPAQKFERSDSSTQLAAPGAPGQANTQALTSQFQYSSISPQSVHTINAAQASDTSASQFNQSFASSQLPLAEAGSGGTRYTPYSSTHTRAHVGGSNNPLSDVQPGIANAQYSPYRQETGYEYNPNTGLVSSLFETIHDSAAGGTNASPGNIQRLGNPDNKAGRATEITASQSLSAGPPEATGKHRSFMAHYVPFDTSHRSIIAMFPITEYPSLEDVCLKHLSTRGMVSFSFGDLRDTVGAINKIRQVRPDWQIVPTTSQEIANFHGENGTKRAAFATVSQDGGFLLSVYAIPSQWTMRPMEVTVREVVASLGTLRTCKIIEQEAGMSRYYVEYFNVRHAVYAFSCLNGFKFDSLEFNVREAYGRGPVISHSRNSSCVSPQSPRTPHHLVSKENEVEENVNVSPASDDSGKSSANIVHPDRILQGLDVRSTVMIRNIPNKITVNELKSIIDESSYGKYDFLYLRMDFTHHCNVGYAFVNFGDPIDILNLMQAIVGKAWPDCISDKRAEVSYATLQGKEALVSKFRNSHVMTRPHAEQPRLFYLEGPQRGTEAPFPSPNDASKLRRSVASTTQQGLFSPRSRPPTTPRTDRARSQSQPWSQTPRGRGSFRTPQHSARRSVHYGPGEFSPMRPEDRQFISHRN